jgi:hypothetical protein
LKKIVYWKEKLPESYFKNIQRAFKKLAHPFPDAWKERLLAQYYLTEQSMMDGFETLFGFRCDVMAKIMYATMTKEKDQSKITFDVFVENLYGLVDESKLDNATRCIFNLLDVRNKGQLDVFMLIQIINNSDRNTHFA